MRERREGVSIIIILKIIIKKATRSLIINSMILILKIQCILISKTFIEILIKSWKFANLMKNEGEILSLIHISEPTRPY